MESIAPKKTRRYTYVPGNKRTYKKRNQRLFLKAMGLKFCSKCHDIKDVSEFAKNRSAYDKLSAYCRSCTSGYHFNNRDRQNEQSKKWRQENPETFRSSVATWYEKNKDKLRAQRYTEEGRAKIRERLRKWRAKNPGIVSVYYHNRRAKLAESGGTYTLQDVQALYEWQYGQCFYCGKFTDGKFHTDHFIPLARGGTNDAENLVIACVACNCRKSAAYPWEWDGYKVMRLETCCTQSSPDGVGFPE